MIRRPRRVVPATLAALVLVAVAVAVAVSCVQVVLGREPWVPFGALGAAGAGVAWNEPVVLAAGGVVAALGIAALLSALLPGTPTVLPLAAVDGRPATGVTRSSLAGALRAAAAGVDGVDAASVRVRARVVTLSVRTPLREPGALAEDVRAVTTERLDDIALRRRPRVRVRVAARRGAASGASR